MALRLGKLSWRDLRVARDAEEARSLATRGVACRLLLAPATLVSYVRPFLTDGATPTAASFATAVLGPESYWVPDLEAVFLPGAALITESSLLLPFGTHLCDELDYDCDAAATAGIWQDGSARPALHDWHAERLAAAVPLPGTTLVLHPKYHRNHYHWHVEGLSQHSAIAGLAASLGRIGVPPLAPAQVESLAVLPLSVPRVQLGDPIHRFEVAVLLTHALSRTWLHPAAGVALQALGRAAREGLAPGATGRNAVYLARTDSATRPMLNEAALCDALRARGFQIVTASTLTFAEQVRVTAAAQLLVSPHGAGLANLIYAQPGTRVIELRPLHAVGRSPFWDKTFWLLAGLVGCRYGTIAFENAPDSDPWSCDVPWLADRLAALASA